MDMRQIAMKSSILPGKKVLRLHMALPAPKHFRLELVHVKRGRCRLINVTMARTTEDLPQTNLGGRTGLNQMSSRQTSTGRANLKQLVPILTLILICVVVEIFIRR